MEEATSRHWLRWTVLAVAGLAVGVAGVAVGLAIAGDDDQPVTAGQVANVQQACEQWMATGAPPVGESGWCTGMTGWMSDQMGRTGMSPQMMWGDPSRMLASCRQWMSDSPPANTVEPQAWCDGMVEWMTDHIADWPGWMMDGRMMMGG